MKCCMDEHMKKKTQFHGNLIQTNVLLNSEFLESVGKLEKLCNLDFSYHTISKFCELDMKNN